MVEKRLVMKKMMIERIESIECQLVIENVDR